MKNIITIIFLLIFGLSWTVCLADETKLSATSLSVETIITYYSSMADLQKTNRDFEPQNDYGTTLAFILNNKQRIISKIKNSQGYTDLITVNRIINGMYENKDVYQAYSYSKSMARGRAYFDSVTGHMYKKNNDGTYSEFTKKGLFFKIVPSDQPHLATNRNIHPIMDDNFMLYVKNSNGINEYKTLPHNHNHPEGWKLDKILVAKN